MTFLHLRRREIYIQSKYKPKSLSLPEKRLWSQDPIY